MFVAVIVFGVIMAFVWSRSKRKIVPIKEAYPEM